jgi:hypothetical protein
VIRRRLAALLVVLALTPSAAAEDGVPAVDTLLRQFEVVAFGTEFGGVHREGRIVKWTEPIRVRIRGFNASRYRAEVATQLTALSRLSGLDIRLVTWSSAMIPPQIDVNFVSARGMSDRDPEAPCLTRVIDNGYVLKRAEIFISPDERAQRMHCIVEELTQAMGLLRDSNLFKDSIFNDDFRGTAMSPWDALMVRVLYDARLRPGMGKGEALPIARAIIIDELRKRGLKPAQSAR